LQGEYLFIFLIGYNIGVYAVGKLKDKKNKHPQKAKDEVLSLAPNEYGYKNFVCASNGEYKSFPKEKRIQVGASGKVVFCEECPEVSQTALLVPKCMNWIRGCETG
jgi:hypothetical protein